VLLEHKQIFDMEKDLYFHISK